MLRTRKNIGILCIYLLFAFFYIWLAAQIPYTHDDWDWGLDIGMQQLITASVNSRYAGNLIEVIMTRSELLKTLIIGTGYFLIPFLISHIVAGETKENRSSWRITCFILSSILLLLMDRKIWQQTYGWVAGYANFGISAIFMLIAVGSGLHVFNEINLQKNCLDSRCVLLFLSGIVGQLFLENIAVFMVLYSIVIGFIYYRRTGTLSKKYLCLALGTVVGFAILFSSNIYRQLWTTGTAIEGYRQVHINANISPRELIISVIYQTVNLLNTMMEYNTLILGTILLILSVAFLLRSSETNKWNSVCIFTNIFLLTLLISHHFWGFISDALYWIIVHAVYFLVVTCEIIYLFIGEKLLLGKLLSVWLSTYGVVAPLVVTSELGPRLFLTTDVLLILFSLMLLDTIKDHIPKKIRQLGTIFIMVLAITLSCFYVNIYREIRICTDQRNAIIKRAVENDDSTIVLPNYPHSDFLWIPNPANDLRVGFFKEFYNIPQDVTIIFEE